MGGAVPGVTAPVVWGWSPTVETEHRYTSGEESEHLFKMEESGGGIN